MILFLNKPQKRGNFQLARIGLLEECLESKILHRVVASVEHELGSRHKFLASLGLSENAGEAEEDLRGLEQLAMTTARNPAALFERPTEQDDPNTSETVPSMGQSFGKVTLAEVHLGQESVVRA